MKLAEEGGDVNVGIYLESAENWHLGLGCEK
jgi:hypothetical protein